jgi:alcohol dehydrogenase class IV
MSAAPVSYDFRFPVAIRYGQGISGTIGTIAGELSGGTGRALVVSDSGVIGAGITDPIERSLIDANFVVDWFTIEGEPREEDIEGGTEVLHTSQPAVVIGVGGGSSLDTAKAVNMQAHNGSLRELKGAASVPNPGLPFISVPTTAGTGSEVGGWAVIVDPDTKTKWAVGDPRYAADVCLLDPTLTVSLPPGPTAYSGIDALAQAMGAYVVTITQPLVEPLALYAIDLLFNNLERAVQEGGDISARQKMQLGSAIGGVCMGNAECAADHAFGEVVGPYYGIPHGLSVAVFLPAVTDFNREAQPERYARIAAAARTEWGALPAGEATAALVGALSELNTDLGVPRLSALGVRREDLAELVDRTAQHFCIDINPRTMDRDDIKEIYERVLTATPE